MSQSLSTARRGLASISSHVKQGNLIQAVQTLRAGVQAMLQHQLLKAERSEMEEMVRDGIMYLGYDRNLGKIYPIQIEYKPGEEKALIATLDDLLVALHEHSVGNANQLIESRNERWQALIDDAEKAMREGEFDRARKLAAQVMKENPTGKEMHLDIALRFLQAGAREDAVEYLEKITEGNGYSASACNWLGIARRRLKRFGEAEAAFKKAVELDNSDPNIYFNLGRLYLDWEKWASAYKAAEQAATLDPEFAEAVKLAEYAKKRI